MRLLLVGVVLAAGLGCSRGSGQGSPTGTTDAGNMPIDAAADAVAGEAGADASSCFTNPQTYLEIINACTDAQAIDKTDDLSPMNLADGGLQPLP